MRNIIAVPEKLNIAELVLTGPIDELLSVFGVFGRGCADEQTTIGFPSPSQFRQGINEYVLPLLLRQQACDTDDGPRLITIMPFFMRPEFAGVNTIVYDGDTGFRESGIDDVLIYRLGYGSDMRDE